MIRRGDGGGFQRPGIFQNLDILQVQRFICLHMAICQRKSARFGGETQ